VVIELNEKAEILTKEEYFPFGGTALLWGSEIDVNLKEYRFAGKEKDAAGLYYFETRYYACVYGRMVSADSAAYIKPENPASLNLYAYCGNEPVSNIDPTGHCREPSKTFIFAGADQIFRAKMAYASKPNTFVRQIYHKTEPPSRKIEDKFLPSWSSMQSDENSTVIIWQHGNPESIQGVKYRQMDKTKQASELILFSCRTANKMENLGEKNIAEEMLDAFPNVLRVVGSRGVHKGHYAAGGMSQGRKFLASIGHQAKKCFVVYSRNERGETIETQLKEGKVYDLFSLRNAVRGIPSYSRAALPPPNQAA
jgi:RHS repeat-associated protein